jgi:hypothetical protein
MSYYVQTRWGGSEDVPNAKRMKEILNELDTDDPEHPDCWLEDDEGRTLSVSQSGIISYETSEDDNQPRHLVDVTREKAFALWQLLINHDLDTLEQEAWQAGHSPPRSPEEQKRIEDEAAGITLESDKLFYDSLGDEYPDRPCRREGCRRGSVAFSVLCRVHHFESICGRPSPFDH